MSRFRRLVAAFVGVAVMLIGTGTVALTINTRSGGEADGSPLDVVVKSLRSQGNPEAVIATFDNGVINDFRTIGEEDYGPNTPFYIGSTSKSLTAMTIARLVDQGRLSFDDTVVSHLPWFRAEGAYSDITIRHLLNQTSGLPEWAGQVDLFEPETSLVQRVRDLASAQMVSAPGEEFHYCNKNFATLGLIIEAVTGRSYADVLQSEVLDPLRMSSTYTSPEDVPGDALAQGTLVMFGAHVPWPTLDYPGALPDGYVISTAHDLVIFADTMVTGEHGGAPFVTQPVVSDLHTPPPGVAPDDTYVSTYGMGLRVKDVEGKSLLWHEGDLATFHANFGVFSDDRSGIVVLTAHKSQMFDSDTPFLTGMEVAAGGTAQPDDGGYWWFALTTIVIAALLIATLVVDVLSWPKMLRQRNLRRLLRHALPRLAIGVALVVGTFVGLGQAQGLPGPMPLAMAWTAAPDVSFLVLGTGAYLIISAVLLTALRQQPVRISARQQSNAPSP